MIKMIISSYYLVFYSYAVLKISRSKRLSKKGFRHFTVLECSRENHNSETNNNLRQNSFWFKVKKNRTTIIISGIIIFFTIFTVWIFVIRSVNFVKGVVIYIRKNDLIHQKSSQTVLTTGKQLFDLLLSFLWVSFICSFAVRIYKESSSVLQQKYEAESYSKTQKISRSNFLSFRNFAFVLFMLYLACIVLLALAGIVVPSALGPFYFKLAELLISSVIIAPGITSNGVIMSSISMFTQLIHYRNPIVVTTMSREDGLLYYLAVCPPKLVNTKQLIEGVIGVRSSSDGIAYIGTVEYIFSENLTLVNYMFNKAFWYFFWHLVYTELAIKIYNVLYFLPYLPVVQVEKKRHLESNLEGVFDFKIKECDPNCCFPEKLIDDTVEKIGLSIDDVIIAFSWIRISSIFCTTTLSKDFETYKLKDFEIRETDRKEKLSYVEYKKRKN